MSIESNLLRTAVGRVSHEAIKIEYTGESLFEKQREFVQVSGELADIKEEKKQVMDAFKERMKPLELEQARLLNITRLGYEIKNMDVKAMANDTDGTVEFYDINSGEYLGNRRQYPNERQSLFNQ